MDQFNIFFNPFSFIFESKTYPHARTLRTTFLQKLIDMFVIVNGSIGDNHVLVGLFDYLTLGIPFLFYYLLALCIDNKDANLLSKSMYYIVRGCQFLFNCLRGIFIFAAFIIALPIVAIVHFIAKVNKIKYEVAAMTLKGHADDMTIPTTLGEVLTQHEYRLDITEDTNKAFLVSHENKKITFHDRRKHYPARPTRFFEACIEPTQKTALQGLLHMNYAGITEEMEANYAEKGASINLG